MSESLCIERVTAARHSTTPSPMTASAKIPDRVLYRTKFLPPYLTFTPGSSRSAASMRQNDSVKPGAKDCSRSVVAIFLDTLG